MLIAAIVLFLIAATFGLFVLTAVLRNQSTPKPFVFMHGIVAVVGVLIVIGYVVIHGVSSPITSLVLFLIAALGGITLFTIDMRKKPVPKWLAVLHPVIAVVALIFLIAFVVVNK